MAFNRPSLSALIDRAQSDINSRLPSANARLPNSLLSILARMSAGSAHELYGAISYLAANLLPNTQDETILEQWAQIYAVPRLEAVAATGSVTFSGTGTVPQGCLLQGDNGQRYRTDRAATIADTGSLAVTAVQAGNDGNLSAGELTLVSPVAGIQPKASISQALAGGADLEDVSSWSARLLQRIQNPPQGGAASDYDRWARGAHPDITHAWVFPTTPQPGQVTVYVMSYGKGNGIPDNATLEAVNTHVQAERPVAAQVFVFAPVPKTLNFTVGLNPYTEAVKTAAQAALKELFEREAAPGKVLPLSHVHETLSGVFGEYDHSLSLSQADLTPVDGEILLLGNVTFEALP